tara:strand:- start:2581 stop:3027 length:447 start_codon:yes stop_codon:yes gene_type:complete
MKYNKNRKNREKLAISQIQSAGMRLTPQRLALAKRLFSGPDRHITAEELHSELKYADVRISLATVYNTLNRFTNAGLLREFFVDSNQSYFDTNTEPHHHFFYEELGKLVDVPINNLNIEFLPSPPKGTQVDSVEVFIKLSKVDSSNKK